MVLLIINLSSISFYPRWKEYEKWQASMLHFTLEDAQWQEDWSNLLSLANQPGSSLEQLHIFALAHILRRPIIVYGVKYVKSFRGEDIGYARFEGYTLYLCSNNNYLLFSIFLIPVFQKKSFYLTFFIIKKN